MPRACLTASRGLATTAVVAAVSAVKRVVKETMMDLSYATKDRKTESGPLLSALLYGLQGM